MPPINPYRPPTDAYSLRPLAVRQATAMKSVSGPRVRSGKGAAGGAGSAGVGPAEQVRLEPTAERIATHPFPRKSSDPTSDTITLSRKVQRMIDERSKAKTLRTPLLTMGYDAHPTTSKPIAMKGWQVPAQIDVTPSGGYTLNPVSNEFQVASAQGKAAPSAPAKSSPAKGSAANPAQTRPIPRVQAGRTAPAA